MTAARAIIACLGAGRMGRGIAVAFAYAGHAVTMIDVKARSAEQFERLRPRRSAKSENAGKHGAVWLADRRATPKPIIARVSVVPAHDMADAFPAPASCSKACLKLSSSSARCWRRLQMRRTRYRHRLDDIDHSGRRSLRRGRKSPTLSQCALAQSGLSDSAGRDFAGGSDRSRLSSRRVKASARGHRQSTGGVRRDARLYRAADPGPRHERGGADGGGRRRQRRGYRQGDPLRLWLPLCGAGPAGVHRLGRRRYPLLRQPLSRGRACTATAIARQR